MVEPRIYRTLCARREVGVVPGRFKQRGKIGVTFVLKNGWVLGMVIQACDPSSLEGSDQEDSSSRPSQAKSS
jgi:hypothetical protein